jgi:hypothetical protein
MSFMDQVFDRGVAQREPVPVAKFTDTSDSFTAGLSLFAQGRKGLVEHFMRSVKMPALDLFVDDALLFGVEGNTHGKNLRAGNRTVNPGEHQEFKGTTRGVMFASYLDDR